MVNAYAASTGFKPGQKILLQAGSVFHESLLLANTQTQAPYSNSGSAGAPITIASYGTGIQPILDEADPVATTWNMVSGATYSTPFTGYPSKMFVDLATTEGTSIAPSFSYNATWQSGVAYPPYSVVDAQKSASCTGTWMNLNGVGAKSSFGGSNNQWFCLPYGDSGSGSTFVTAVPPSYQVGGLANVEANPGTIGAFWTDGTTLYVHLADGTSPSQHSIEMSNRPYGVNLQNVSYVTVDNLKIIHAGKSGILANQYSAAGDTISNIVLTNNTIFNSGDIGEDFPATQGKLYSGINNNEGNITMIPYPSSAGVLVSPTVTGNYIGTEDGYPQLNYAIAGIGIYSSTNAVVTGNTVRAVNAEGIRLSTAGGSCSTAQILNNDVSNSQGNIRISGCPNSIGEHNKLHDSFGFGYQVGGGSLHTMLAYDYIYNIRGSSGLIAPGVPGTPGGGGTLYNGIDCNGGGDYLMVYNETVYNISGNSLTLEKPASPYNACPHADVRNTILDASANVRPNNTYGSGTGSLFIQPESQPPAIWSNNLTKPFTNATLGGTNGTEPYEFDWQTRQHGVHWMPLVQFEVLANGTNDIDGKTLNIFNNPAADDFTLAANSPACGSGIPIAALNQSAPVNIGASQNSCNNTLGAATLQSIQMQSALNIYSYGYSSWNLGSNPQWGAVGVYSDGTTRTLPNNMVVWASSAPLVASITSSGFMTTLSAGNTTITAKFGGVTGSVSIVVTAPTAAPAIATATASGGMEIVTVTDSNASASIYCTTDGTAPTTSSPTYAGPLTVAAGSQIQCFANAGGTYYTAGSTTIVGPSHVWTANSNGTASEFNTSGVPVSTTGFTGGGHGVAIDATGDVWQVNSSGSAVTEFSQTGAVLNSGYAGAGLSGANELAIDGSGQVWLTNGSSNSLSVFSSSGAAVSPPTGYQPGFLNQPTGLAIDISGNVWIANAGNSSVSKMVGVAAPVIPTANAVQNNTLAVRP